jgi:hypothetical protein
MEISRARHPGGRRHPASEQSRRILCTGELWRVRTSERSGTWSIRGGSQWSDLSVKTPVAGGTPPCDEVRGVGEGQSYQSRHGRSWAVHPVQSGVVAHTMGGSWIHHSAQTAPTAGSNPWTTVARASVRRISIRDMLGERMREMRLSRFLQLFEVPSRRLNCPPWVSEYRCYTGAFVIKALSTSAACNSSQNMAGDPSPGRRRQACPCAAAFEKPCDPLA